MVRFAILAAILSASTAHAQGINYPAQCYRWPGQPSTALCVPLCLPVVALPDPAKPDDSLVLTCRTGVSLRITGCPGAIVVADRQGNVTVLCGGWR